MNEHREKLCVVDLKKIVESEGLSGSDVHVNIVEEAMKRQKLGAATESPYLNLSFLVPTSNLCERLFSKCGYTITDRREGLIPENIECQIFLHMNMDLWDISTIKEILI